MTPAQYRAALDRLGITQSEAAELLDISVRTSHSYANGQPIPRAIEFALKYLQSITVSREAMAKIRAINASKR